jgi:hypothetical protein
MSIRKRDDSIKSGQGISNGRGEDFTKQYRQDPWAVRNPGGSEKQYDRLNSGSRSADKFAEYGKSQFNPTRPDDFQFRAATRSVWDDTCGDEGNGDVNGGFSGPIRYGVNKSQS